MKQSKKKSLKYFQYYPVFDFTDIRFEADMFQDLSTGGRRSLAVLAGEMSGEPDLLLSEVQAEGDLLVTYGALETAGLHERFGHDATSTQGDVVSWFEGVSNEIRLAIINKGEDNFNSVQMPPYEEDDTTSMLGEEAPESVPISALASYDATAPAGMVFVPSAMAFTVAASAGTAASAGKIDETTHAGADTGAVLVGSSGYA